MKKLCNIISLIPIAFITLIFLSDEEIKKHFKSECVGLLLLFIIFCFIYYLIFCVNCNRYVATAIGLIMWIIVLIIKNKIM